MRAARAQFHFIYPVKGPAGACHWYLIHRGRVAASLPAPRKPAHWHEAKALIENVYASTWNGPRSADETDDVLLVSAWFRRHPQELQRVIPPDQAVKK